VLKRGLPCAALAAVLVLPAPAGAGELLAPGVTHERDAIFNGGRPVALHIVRTPAPSDLYRLLPVRAGGGDVRRQSVPAMQARLSPRATTVGVNGDFFNLQTGHPTGLFLRDGVLWARPSQWRSALALGLDGRLLVDLFDFDATWQGATGAPRRLHELNRPVEQNLSKVGLFTRSWGDETPRARGALELVLGGFPRATLDADLTGTVAAVERGGRTSIPVGGAVLQARGEKRKVLQARGPAGTAMTVRLHVPELPAGTLEAIGGGPTLVRNGAVVAQAGQGFSPDTYAVRHPRTAVGQLANGRLLFVVADGRSSRSYGLTTRALARVMADRGAVTAMALDGGGSSTLAFDGRVLNTPSDGAPRRVANGLFVHYYGIYSPKAGGTVLSPNGDGVGDRKALAAKLVRRSDVSLRLLRPDGSVAWSRQDVVGPGWIRRVVSNPGMPEGRWWWEVEATDLQSGRRTGMERAFRVNKTLGHLRLSKTTMRVKPGSGGRLGISVRLTRTARVETVVLAPDGGVRRVLLRGERGPARLAWQWNGKTGSGRVVQAGTYSVRVTARNQLGVVELRQSVRVLRPASG
jgi:Phosphodiester glycosidase